MQEHFKSLIFTVLGGVIVASFTFFFLSEKKNDAEVIAATHRKIDLIYGDRIIHNFVSELVSMTDTSDKKERLFYFDTLMKLLEKKNFGGFVYNEIHSYKIENVSKSLLKDITIVNNYEYTSYIINHKSETPFKILKSGERDKIDELLPEEALFIICFSRPDNFDLKVATIIHNDKLVEPINLSLTDTEMSALRFARDNIALAIPAASLLLLGGFLFLILVPVTILLHINPRIYGEKFLSKGDYERFKKVLSFYEAKKDIKKETD